MENMDAKECVKVQFTLCNEALRRVKEKQEDHFRSTGIKLSKRLAIIKLILGK
jgi:hypothetical protein